MTETKAIGGQGRPPELAKLVALLDSAARGEKARHDRLKRVMEAACRMILSSNSAGDGLSDRLRLFERRRLFEDIMRVFSKAGIELKKERHTQYWNLWHDLGEALRSLEVHDKATERLYGRCVYILNGDCPRPISGH